MDKEKKALVTFFSHTGCGVYRKSNTHIDKHSRHGMHTLDYAESICLGTRNYELVVL